MNTIQMEEKYTIGLDGRYTRCGEIEGIQSLNNEKTYVYAYDSKIGDFVGKWIPTPDFVKTSYGKHKVSPNR